MTGSKEQTTEELTTVLFNWIDDCLVEDLDDNKEADMHVLKTLIDKLIKTQKKEYEEKLKTERERITQEIFHEMHLCLRTGNYYF